MAHLVAAVVGRLPKGDSYLSNVRHRNRVPGACARSLGTLSDCCGCRGHTEQPCTGAGLSTVRQSSGRSRRTARANATVTPELLRAPATHPASGFHAQGLEALFFDAMPWKGKPTRVFALVGVPKLEPGKKAPGIVLVHGGGGTAFETWVRLWMSRGYAAIAMDTCGAVPRGSYGKWDRHEAGGPPSCNFDLADEPMTDQWPYHAVADVILAHSLLRSRPEVDGERMGITGIS
jgi:hypothetical protein